LFNSLLFEFLFIHLIGLMLIQLVPELRWKYTIWQHQSRYYERKWEDWCHLWESPNQVTVKCTAVHVWGLFPSRCWSTHMTESHREVVLTIWLNNTFLTKLREGSWIRSLIDCIMYFIIYICFILLRATRIYSRMKEIPLLQHLAYGQSGGQPTTNGWKET